MVALPIRRINKSWQMNTPGRKLCSTTCSTERGIVHEVRETWSVCLVSDGGGVAGAAANEQEADGDGGDDPGDSAKGQEGDHDGDTANKVGSKSKAAAKSNASARSKAAAKSSAVGPRKTSDMRKAFGSNAAGRGARSESDGKSAGGKVTKSGKKQAMGRRRRV